MATQESLDLAQTLYVAYYGRPADRAGLNYWADEIDANGVDAMVNAFGNSAEFEARFGNLSNEQLINNLYQQMFGRSAELAGLDFYSAQLANGESTLAEIALDIANGAQNEDATALSNKVAVAANFTAAIDTTEEVLAYAGDSAANSARDFLATVNAETDAETVDVDAQLSSLVQAVQDETTAGETFTLTADVGEQVTGTAGNDTFRGVVDNGGTATSTINVGDIIDGGAGTDRLNILAESGTLPTGFETTSVENVFITNNALGTVNANVFDGLEQLWFVDNTIAVSANNLNADITLGLQGNAIAAVTGEFGTATSANLALDEAEGTGPILNGASVRTVNVSGSTAGTGVTLTGTAVAAAETLNVAAADSLSLDVSAAAAAETVNVSGEGEADLGTLNAVAATLDSTASTGGVTATSANADLNVAGGAGDDRISLTTQTLSEDASIVLGAGDDALLATGAASLGSQVVDGGEGVDTIAATLVTAGSAGNIQNFEVLDLANYTGSIDANLLTESDIQALELTAAVGGTATVTNLPGTTSLDVSAFGDIDPTTLTQALGNVTVVQDGAASGTSDSFDLNFNAQPVAAATTNDNVTDFGTLTLSGTETVNVASGGSEFQDVNAVGGIVDTLNQMATINISGDKDFVLAGVETGSANTATSAVDSSLSLIDGSSATGDLTITAGTDTNTGAQIVSYDGLTINGGEGDDTITNNADKGVVVAGAGDDAITVTGDNAVVTTGAGEDTVTVSADYGQTASATSAQTGVVTTITDIEAGDTIDFGTAVAAFSKADISTAQTLDQAVFAASSATANEVEWFEYSGDTYIVNSGAAAGTADDIVVKLTGSVDLSDATLSGGDLVIA